MVLPETAVPWDRAPHSIYFLQPHLCPPTEPQCADILPISMNMQIRSYNNFTFSVINTILCISLYFLIISDWHLILIHANKSKKRKILQDFCLSGLKKKKHHFWLMRLRVLLHFFVCACVAACVHALPCVCVSVRVYVYSCVSECNKWHIQHWPFYIKCYRSFYLSVISQILRAFYTS